MSVCVFRLEIFMIVGTILFLSLLIGKALLTEFLLPFPSKARFLFLFTGFSWIFTYGKRKLRLARVLVKDILIFFFLGPERDEFVVV